MKTPFQVDEDVQVYVFGSKEKVKLSAVALAVFNLGLLTIAALLWILPSALKTSSPTTDRELASTSSSSQQSSKLPAAEIARQVTVRILTDSTSGSGVIINRQGRTYTVLTCEHVVAESQSDRYSVLTEDGITQPAFRKLLSHLGDTDLALVQFESNKLYNVAALGNSDALLPGNRVYASGFPNYQFIHSKQVEDTRNWGKKAFRLTTGEVSLLLERSLPEGYRLGYTNEVEQGMSGGPVLNEKGQLVGINGRLKYPLQGIDVFTFADGSKPSVELFKKMEALSWAIPITTFEQAKRHLTFDRTPKHTDLGSTGGTTGGEIGIWEDKEDKGDEAEELQVL